MVRGSCLCGAVAWEAEGRFAHMSHCHCSMCRKEHGAAFGTYVAAQADGFRFLRGQERVTRYRASSLFERPFCSRCGAVTPTNPDDGWVSIAAGCLDDDPGVRPEAHIFATSKAPWYEITDDLPRFDAYSRGPGPVVESREREPSGDGVVRGSCLRGAVAWEIDAKPSPIRNCHCSRCRKSRSAAHASNVFCEPGAFRWVSGEGLLKRFRVPGAKRFGSVFCTTCGSVMPRVDETFVVVPAGSIDGDPGLAQEAHIFVASKAPWFEITDGLPQFEAYPVDR